MSLCTCKNLIYLNYWNSYGGCECSQLVLKWNLVKLRTVLLDVLTKWHYSMCSTVRTPNYSNDKLCRKKRISNNWPICCSWGDLTHRKNVREPLGDASTYHGSPKPKASSCCQRCNSDLTLIYSLKEMQFWNE